MRGGVREGERWDGERGGDERGRREGEKGGGEGGEKKRVRGIKREDERDGLES